MQSLFQQALQAFKSDQVVQAKALLNRLINEYPQFAAAYNLAGEIACKEGNHHAAEAKFQQAISLNKDHFVFYLNLGQLYFNKKKHPQAVVMFEKSLRLNPQQLDLRQSVIEYYTKTQNLSQAYTHLNLYLSSNPNAQQALYLFIEISTTLGQYEQAYQRLKTLNSLPVNLQLWEIFAQTTLNKQQDEWAQKGFEYLCLHHPSPASAFYQLGMIYGRQKKYEDALRSFNRAIELQDDYGEAYLNRAFLFHHLNHDIPNIIADIEVALTLNPSLEHALFDYWKLLSTQTELSMALLNCLVEKGHQLRIQAASYLMSEYETRGQIEKAHFYCQKILDIEPHNYWYEIKQATLMPIFYSNQDEILNVRKKIDYNLDKLLKKYKSQRLNILKTSVSLFSLKPFLFYLAYQGMNDKALSCKLSRIWQEIYTQYVPLPIFPKKQKGQPIKVGFLSQYFRNHSVMDYYSPLILHLAQDPKFEVICITFHTQENKSDHISEQLKSKVQTFLSLDFKPDFYKEIYPLELDMLIYPDIGMNHLSYLSAQLKLAPFQLVMAGHPVTSGIPTIDYFISWAFESLQADPHYSEQLIRQKSIALNYTKPMLSKPDKTRKELNLPVNMNIYFIPVTLFKIHHEFDAIILKILLKDPKGLCLFVHDAQQCLSELLFKRFKQTMPQVIHQIDFLPWLDFDTYLHIMSQADIVLDTIHFGGGNTIRQILAVGTPLMTWPSPFLRGRSGSGICSAIGLTECMADNPQDYVEKAVNIATDKTYQQHLRKKILQCNQQVFHQTTGLQELSLIFQELVYGSNLTSAIH